MTAYFDSSLLVKLYVPEPNSPKAAASVRRYSPPILFTQLQENEVRNAIRLKAGRKEISDNQLRLALSNVTADFNADLLHRPVVDWPSVWQAAEKLSHKYSRKTLCRTLDALHVAVALLLNIDEFVTFDERQRLLAEKAGLCVRPERAS